MLTYDGDAGHYWFRTRTSDARGADATRKKEGDAFQWSTSSAYGSMRHTIRLTVDGEWLERGEGSREGKTWYPFFDMKTRRRQPNTKPAS